MLTLEKLPITINSVMPPTIVFIKNKRYAIIESDWYECDKTITHDSLLERHRIPTIYTHKDSTVKQFTVKSSSDKGKSYTVTLRVGSWMCTCPSYGFRRRCKHIEKTKNKYVRSYKSKPRSEEH